MVYRGWKLKQALHLGLRGIIGYLDGVTVGYYTKNRTRYLSIYAHKDGTWDEFLSQTGRNTAPSSSGRIFSRRDK